MARLTEERVTSIRPPYQFVRAWGVNQPKKGLRGESDKIEGNELVKLLHERGNHLAGGLAQGRSSPVSSRECAAFRWRCH